MHQTVFYSWQSDTDSKLCRNPIEKAIEKALKQIRGNKTARLNAVIDRDTSGLAGSPDISDSIFAKISRADVFVADVTIINARARSRKTPNPNVLVELGFAISVLGWERILLIQNTAFGDIESLPFDLRGRRVIPYKLASADQRAIETGALSGRLESGLRAALQDSTGTVLKGVEAPLWLGRWEIHDRGSFNGDLQIREVGSNSFLFDLTVNHGSHLGNISGTAQIASRDVAHFHRDSDGETGPCELVFRRQLLSGIRQIRIEESVGCLAFHGMAAHFEGTYLRRSDPLFDAGFLTEIELQRLQGLMGQHYSELFRSLAWGEYDSKEEIEVRAFRGGMPGLYTITEALVMVDERGRMWAAFLSDSRVSYFTTERKYQKSLPATFDEWRANFMDVPVDFEPAVDRVPRGLGE